MINIETSQAVVTFDGWNIEISDEWGSKVTLTEQQATLICRELVAGQRADRAARREEFLCGTTPETRCAPGCCGGTE